MEPFANVPHREVAVKAYNLAWTLLEKPSRTPEEDVTLERLAFASVWHWSFIGDPSNESIGEWFLSRMYVSLMRPVEAATHASRAVAICEANSIGDFVFASALEGKARAFAMLGLRTEAKEIRDRAVAALLNIKDPEDRAHIEGQIFEGPWFGLF